MFLNCDDSGFAPANRLFFGPLDGRFAYFVENDEIAVWIGGQIHRYVRVEWEDRHTRYPVYVYPGTTKDELEKRIARYIREGPAPRTDLGGDSSEDETMAE